MDRLRALAVFRAVVEHQGFCRAAEAMNLSRAAVTRAVQDLEEHLNVRLLSRSTRSVALTSIGQEIFERATGLLDAYGDLEAFSSQSASEPHGHIRMAAAASFGRHYLGRALAAFRERWPRVVVDLALRDNVPDAMIEETDLMLSVGGELRQTVVVRELTSLEVGWYASPGYLDRKGLPRSPEDVSRFDCLVRRSLRASGWTFVHNGTGARAEVPVRGVFHSSDDEVLLEAALHGAGLVLLPNFMAEALLGEGQLSRVLLDWHSDPVSVYLTYESRRHQPLAVRMLIEHLVEQFRGAQSEGPAGPFPTCASHSNAGKGGGPCAGGDHLLGREACR